MCVIVHQPTGQHLTKEDAKKLWDTNPDGGGFAFIDDQQTVQVQKHMEFNPFWSSFERARSDFPRRDFLLHMRIATHGSVEINNVHPFEVNNTTVMAHNGILHGVTPFLDAKTDDRSDTRFFADEVLPNLPSNWLDNYFLQDMVEEWIGWSKLMFLTTDSTLEKSVYRLGDWKEWNGLYMSNLDGVKPVFKNHWNRDTASKSFSNQSTIYNERSDDWYDWWMYKESEFDKDDNGKTKIDTALDKAELGFLMDAIWAERKELGITHGMQIVDTAIGDMLCTGCDAIIDIDTAECRCWDVVCDNCWQFKALCTRDTCFGAATWDFDGLTATGQNFVLNGGKDAKKYNKDTLDVIAENVAKALPSGA